MAKNSPRSAIDNRPSALLFVLFFAALVLTHLPLLRLPYFWDEAGYYVPAARDLLLSGSLIPHSTMSNAHPPLLIAFLAAAWKLFGYSALVTRLAMLLVAAFALLGVFRLARQVANQQVAIAATICTALFPVFFAQSSMAHLDMAAAALITWGIFYYLKQRRWLAIIFFALACLAKETAAIVPLALFGWEVILHFDRGRFFPGSPDHPIIRSPDHPMTRSFCLLLPLLPLALWFAYHYARTGYVLGNPEFVRYNLADTLHPTRILIAFFMRLWHLLGHMNMFVLTLAAALALRLAPRPDPTAARQKAGGNGQPDLLRRPIALPVQAVFAILILAHVVAFSILGGAALARYLLPVYPLVIILCVSTLRRRVPWWPAFVAVVGAGFVIALLVNPPYCFAPEDNLSYADYVRLHQGAARFIELHYPGRRVLTAWPASDELTRPWLGYVSRPQPVLRIENFSPSEMITAEQARGQYGLTLLFSTKSDARFVLPLPGWERLQERYFGFHRDLTPAAAASLLGARIVYQQRRAGQWVAVLEMQTIENAYSPRRFDSASRRASIISVSDAAPYEELEHAADWSFRVRGRDLAELFGNAARAVSRLEHGERAGETPVTRELRVEGVDRETLLVNWLNELLYLEQARREVYHKFEILEIDDTHLRARVHGAPEQAPQRHIKAVTFHNLEVKNTAHGWEATIVVDV